MNLLGCAADPFGVNGDEGTGAMEARGDATEAGLAGKVFRGEEPAATSMRFSLRSCR